MSESPYPGLIIPTVKLTDQKIQTDVIKIKDVENSIRSLSSFPDYMAVNVSDDNFSKVYSKLLKTHFQGVIRKLGTNILYVSGGDSKKKIANLFILQMGSRKSNSRNPFGSNITLMGTPDIKDLHYENIKINEGEEWHAGGMALLGDLLAIPCEDSKNNTTTIFFYDCTKPKNPIRLENISIKRGPEHGKSGAVALSKLINGHFLCAAWKDIGFNGGELHFYMSKTKHLKDGFTYSKTNPISIRFNSATYDNKKPPRQYQSIQFITQSDGQLYLIGLDKLGKTPDWFKTTPNILDTFKINFPKRTTNSGTPKLELPQITYLGFQNMSRTAKYFSFDAASCVQVDKGNNLYVYSTAMWANKKRITMSEFYAPFNLFSKTISKKSEAYLELYEKENYQGRCLRIFGTQDSEIQNYKSIQVQGKHFEKKIGSIKYLLPKNHIYYLFPKKDMKGSPFSIVGTGKFESLKSLKEHFWTKTIKSSSFEKPQN